MSPFSNGKHPYYGKHNGRAGRQRSKVYAGLKCSFKKLGRAFEQIDNEKKQQTKGEGAVREARHYNLREEANTSLSTDDKRP